MDLHWSPYTDSPSTNRQARYPPQAMTTPQQHSQREVSVPSSVKQDPYTSPHPNSRTNSMGLPQGDGMHGRSAEMNDGDGDVPMEDADPYNKPKYASRANHQQRHSQQFLQQEESSAARRYSPMNLSPTSPYSGSTQQGGQNYTSFTPQTHSNRGSPTRNNPYISPQQNYYSPPGTYSCQAHILDYLLTPQPTASRPHAPQLPPIQSSMSSDNSFYPQSATAQLNAVYNREARSPRATNPNPPQLPPIGRGPVPKFKTVANTAELEPVINAQPPFRRAHPEGGFISVSVGLHIWAM